MIDKYVFYNPDMNIYEHFTDVLNFRIDYEEIPKDSEFEVEFRRFDENYFVLNASVWIKKRHMKKRFFCNHRKNIDNQLVTLLPVQRIPDDYENRDRVVFVFNPDGSYNRCYDIDTLDQSLRDNNVFVCRDDDFNRGMLHFIGGNLRKVYDRIACLPPYTSNPCYEDTKYVLDLNLKPTGTTISSLSLLHANHNEKIWTYFLENDDDAQMIEFIDSTHGGFIKNSSQTGEISLVYDDLLNFDIMSTINLSNNNTIHEEKS